MPKPTDQTYLKNQQYCSAGSLEARITLHQRFSANPIDCQCETRDLRCSWQIHPAAEKGRPPRSDRSIPGLFISLMLLLLAACTPTATPTAIATLAPSGTPIPPTAARPSPTGTATQTPTLSPSPTATITPDAGLPSLSPENAAGLELIDASSQFPAQALAWLPDSLSLALANQEAIQLLLLKDDQEELVNQAPSIPTTLNVSPASGRIAVARPDNSIDLLDPPDGNQVASLIGHSGAITSLAFSADGRWLASAATDNTVRIWEEKTGVFLSGWQLPFWVAGLAFSPDGTRLAGVDLPSFTIHIWEIDQLPLDTPAPLDRPLGGPPPGVTLTWTQDSIPALYQVAFSPDWSQVAWVARGTVQLMQVGDGALGPTFSHEDFVSGVNWSPDGQLFASAAAATVDGQFNPAALIWDPHAGDLVNTLILPEPAAGVSFSPDGKMLAILGALGEVQLWAAPR